MEEDKELVDIATKTRNTPKTTADNGYWVKMEKRK